MATGVILPLAPSTNQLSSLPGNSDSKPLHCIRRTCRYARKVLVNVNELRKAGIFCDVSLVAGGATFQVSEAWWNLQIRAEYLVYLFCWLIYFVPIRPCAYLLSRSWASGTVPGPFRVSRDAKTISVRMELNPRLCHLGLESRSRNHLVPSLVVGQEVFLFSCQTLLREKNTEGSSLLFCF